MTAEANNHPDNLGGAASPWSSPDTQTEVPPITTPEQWAAAAQDGVLRMLHGYFYELVLRLLLGMAGFYMLYLVSESGQLLYERRRASELAAYLDVEVLPAPAAILIAMVSWTLCAFIMLCAAVWRGSNNTVRFVLLFGVIGIVPLVHMLIAVFA